ncbi:MAG: ABC transporter ATP-binding protein [Chloroflexi bacterium]|nr:ABC transporter ATP-binding protein [Chloroflexota bacterium]
MTVSKFGAPASPIIEFDGVSKRYLLQPGRPRSFQELLVSLFHSSRPAKEPGLHDHDEGEFWALRNVSFSIQPGETVGLIGSNGSGKSTILKLIARIVQPTEGTIGVHGRVSALLELGAGFHPDLTGRENIFLNGSILGLSRTEMRHHLTEIVDFAELERFIDMPVKHYSSGMYMRLGFAIAIHTHPDILLVDEVLAVGDESFQNRCLDAIRRLKARNKTIIIVSHSLKQLTDLCDRGIWLEESQIQELGPAADVVRSYLSAVAKEQAQYLFEENAHTAENLAEHNSTRDGTGTEKAKATGSEPEAPDPETPDKPPRRWGTGPIMIEHIQMYDEKGVATWSFRPMQPVSIEIAYQCKSPVAEPIFSVLIHKTDGHYLWASNTLDHPVDPIPGPGHGRLRLEVPGLALTAGRYYLSTAAYAEPDPPFWRTPSDFHEWLYEFQVISPTEIHGDIVMSSRWEHHPPETLAVEVSSARLY